MKLPKPSAETIAYFERIAPGPPIEARRMFGMPARFLNGHMLVAVFGDTFMLHLSESDRAECIRAGAKPFAPMGREAKAYVDVAPGTFDDRTLKEWIVRGMRYLGKLPPKLKARAADTAAPVRSVRAPEKPKANGAGRAAKTKTKTNGAARTAAKTKTKTAKTKSTPARKKAARPMAVKRAKKAPSKKPASRKPGRRR